MQVGEESSARVATALAALHSTPLHGLPLFDVDAMPTRLHRAAEALYEAAPAWEELLAQAVTALAMGHAGLGSEPIVTLHGDLHPRNILVDGTQLSFIDLDCLQAGPAAVELGGWIADLLYRAALDAAPMPETHAASHAFLAAYASATGRAIDPALLAWCTAFDLVSKRASRCVAKLKPGRFEAVPQLLALATAIAATGRIDTAFAVELEAA
jgi:aminoglycoside phosphotransferase (APT) family kinase protein